jgi:hypothetical protein
VRTAREVLDACRVWIASLAPWTHFVTLTHRLPDSSDANRAGMRRRARHKWSITEDLSEPPEFLDC